MAKDRSREKRELTPETEELRLKEAPFDIPVLEEEERVVMSQSNEEVRDLPASIPVLALRDVVIFPYMIFPVLVGRESSLSATSAAVSRDKYIFLVAQRNSQQEDPKAEDLYRFGTLARIVRIIRLPN